MIATITTATSGQAQEKVTPPKIEWQRLNTETEASFRGLSVVDDDVFWVSGAQGTVLKTTDGGKSIRNVSVPDATERDFRDIHAFDAENAIVLNAGSPGVIFRTANGGKNWSRVYNDTRKEIFFDAMDFWDDKNGVAFGDPIDARLVIIRTTDGGKTWRELEQKFQPKMQPGEGGFAASGSCLITNGKKSILIGTGSHLERKSADSSRILISHDRGKAWTSLHVPLARNQSSGIFSLCAVDSRTLIAVGGDYTQPDSKKSNAAVSNDAGRSWKVIKDKPPSGFRSVVVSSVLPNKKRLLVAGGTNGIDLSMDLGKSWTRTSDISNNVIAFAPSGKRLVTAGPKGSVYVGNIQE